MDEYERVLLVKQEVFIYKIPPRTSNRGYRAADWKLDSPDFTGRLRIVTKGSECILKIEDRNNGELFAKCLVDKYPGIAVEPVVDSSRYFVLRIQDDSGHSAFIGIGFADRGDSFDLNVALQDHFKSMTKEEELEKEWEKEGKKHLDLRFKEGETIKINMNIAKVPGTSRPKAKTPSSSGKTLGLLPPPPGGVKILSPTESVFSTASHPTQTNSNSASNSSLAGLGETTPTANSELSTEPPMELWGDFASAQGTTSQPDNGNHGQRSWVQF
ncbi:NECAP-like protein CG9132 [Limulus polyphemus]|uniref:NECAP-like protein CG9132 n=1 Tax=Limulus polyphemus TaxID=6850 RepID=A0ABM1BQ34_LIMPO|nr:NECAP-like protein CG9132 [Limulus polyphemus]